MIHISPLAILFTGLLGLITACQLSAPERSRPVITAFQAAHSATLKTAPCLPKFPYQNGWLGGDGAYSVPLSANQTLWLFGDTFVGSTTTKPPTRMGSTMVANSIGISRCGPHGFEVNYFFGVPENQKATPFFKTAQDKYWPIHGFMHQNKLYVALEQVATISDADNVFNFAVVGVTLTEIANPTDPPQQWRMRYLPLSRSKAAIPGIAMVKKDRYVYMLTVQENKAHPVMLNRLSLDQLANPLVELEYLSRTQGWKKGLMGDDSAILVPQAATEISLHFEPQRQQWIMVHTNPTFWSKEVVIRQAPALEGPWQQKVSLQSLYQEMQPTDPLYDKEIFCYAAKAHPQFSAAPHSLVVTYACNSLNFGKLLQQMGWYYPVVRVLPF